MTKDPVGIGLIVLIALLVLMPLYGPPLIWSLNVWADYWSETP